MVRMVRMGVVGRVVSGGTRRFGMGLGRGGCPPSESESGGGVVVRLAIVIVPNPPSGTADGMRYATPMVKAMTTDTDIVRAVKYLTTL